MGPVSRAFAAALALSLTPLTLLGTGCVPDESELPGEQIGQYSVQGALESNACGAGYEAPSQLYFHVELRRIEGTTIAYWRLSDAPVAQGTVSDEVFRFVDRQEVVAIAAEPDIGVPGCVLERVETVELTLGGSDAVDAGAPLDGGQTPEAGPAADAGAAMPDGFLGTTTVEVGIVPGSECSALLAIYGGPFPTLPCAMRFALAGDRLEEDLW